MTATDLNRFCSVINHEGVEGPVPFIEHDVDPEIISSLIGERLPPADASERSDQELRIDLLIRFYRQAGYNYVPIYATLKWPRATVRANDTAEFSRGEREWYYTSSLIRGWSDFEAFPWPDIRNVDYYMVEYLHRQIPDDMGIYAQGWGGIFEWACFLMGFEQLSLALYDSPELVEAMFVKINELVVGHCENTLDIGPAVAFTVGDDMGYNGGLMVSPDVLRRHVFPGHRRIAGACHSRGIPYLLHSCGDLSTIMEELVEDVGIDGRHSYQDNLIPVEDFHSTWGKRLSVLGGVDVDLLSRGTEAQVRGRTRAALEAIGHSGSWCLGTGNTVTNYIPISNYLAMLDEGARWNAQWE